LSVLYRSKNRQ